MLSPRQELRINVWSGSGSTDDQLLAHIHALVPAARIAHGLSPNQLCVSLDTSDTRAVSALDALLQDEFAALVYSYCWYPKSQPAKA